MTLHQPHPTGRLLGGDGAAGNTADVSVDQQLLGKSGGGDSLPDIPLPDIALLHVRLPDVAFHNVHLPELRPDGSVGEE